MILYVRKELKQIIIGRIVMDFLESFLNSILSIVESVLPGLLEGLDIQALLDSLFGMAENA